MCGLLPGCTQPLLCLVSCPMSCSAAVLVACQPWRCLSWLWIKQGVPKTPLFLVRGEKIVKTAVCNIFLLTRGHLYDPVQNQAGVKMIWFASRLPNLLQWTVTANNLPNTSWLSRILCISSNLTSCLLQASELVYGSRGAWAAACWDRPWQQQAIGVKHRPW